jgi:HK97 gp10 family phage protein
MRLEIDIPKTEIDRLVRQLSRVHDEMRKEVTKLIAKTALAIEATAKKSMSQMGQGRWYTGRGKGRGDHRASAPGDPPATDTGRLRASIRTDLSELTRLSATVGTEVAYGRFLEFGTANMAARPWLRPAYEKHVPDFIRGLRKIL